ncbi:MAG: aminotransferase class I/II-fold pyridoxal phosphate-dependent enzyme [Bacillota bacterium]
MVGAAKDFADSAFQLEIGGIGVMISKRLQAVSPSATLAMDSKAKALQAEGKDIVKFGVGEPDYPTPEHIKEAAIQAIHDNETRYTANPGIAPLKEAVCRKFEEDNDLHFEPDQVLVSTGAKQSIYNALMALVDPGDEVIIVAPYWVSYPQQVKLTQ